MPTIQEGLEDLDRQEQENESRFKAAIHAYFESKAAIKSARQALKFAENSILPGDKVDNLPDKVSIEKL